MSKKDRFSYLLDNIVDEIEIAEFKELTEKQQQLINRRFNTYINFEYCNDNGIAFIISENDFKNFEYFLGMEYEREDILTKVAIDDIVYVVYDSNNERVNELIEMLE